MQDLEKMNSSKNEELNLLKKRIKSQEADNSRIEKELMRLVEEERFRKQDLSGTKKDEKIQQLKDRLAVMNQNIDFRQNDIGKSTITRDDYDRVRNELTSSSNELSRLESEKEAFTKRLTNANSRKDELDNEITKMKQEISSDTKRRVADMNSQGKKLQVELSKHNEIDSDLKIELGKLCKTIDEDEQKTREYMSQRMDDWDGKLQQKSMEI